MSLLFLQAWDVPMLQQVWKVEKHKKREVYLRLWCLCWPLNELALQHGKNKKIKKRGCFILKYENWEYQKEKHIPYNYVVTTSRHSQPQPPFNAPDLKTQPHPLSYLHPLYLAPIAAPFLSFFLPSAAHYALAFSPTHYPFHFTGHVALSDAQLVLAGGCYTSRLGAEPLGWSSP